MFLVPKDRLTTLSCESWFGWLIQFSYLPPKLQKNYSEMAISSRNNFKYLNKSNPKIVYIL